MKNKEISKEVSKMTEHLAVRWKAADKRILRVVFPLLVQGRPVPITRVADETESEPAVVKEALKVMRSEVNAEDQIVELFGLMFMPTFHRVEIKGVTLFTCCALFSQVVPYLVGQVAKVESVDPVSREIVRLKISPDGRLSFEPKHSVANLVVTDPEAVKKDIGSHFCCQVFHFSSRESGAQFVSQNERRYLIPLEEFHEAARLLYKEVWSSGTQPY